MGLFSRDQPLTHFPLVQGARLDKSKVSLPQDLPADATLLIVAFRDELDPLSDQWARLGDRLSERHGDRVATLELPVVTNKLKWAGGLATMGIRGQIDNETERQRTVPIFVDVKAFRKTLRVSSGDVHAYLVARDGRIAWTGEGDIEMDEIEGLERAVEEVLAAPVPMATDHPDLGGPDALDEPEPPDALAEPENKSEEPDDPAADGPAAGA